MALRKKLPLYLQIEAILKSKIITGELKEGDRLPSENELSKQFGVSPLTVRQALSSLVIDGLLDRKPGRGTIVKKNLDEKIIIKLSGEMDELFSIGKETETKVVHSEVIQGVDKPIRNLRLNQGDPVFFVEKLRYWRGTPFMVVEEYVSQSFIGGLSKNNKSIKSLYFLLTQKKGIILKEAIQTIESLIADQRIASLLQVERGSPLFYMERIFYSETGLPILFQVTYALAEHFKFSVHLGRELKEKETKWVLY